jgi:hypothetical protein
MKINAARERFVENQIRNAVWLERCVRQGRLNEPPDAPKVVALEPEMMNNRRQIT